MSDTKPNEWREGRAEGYAAGNRTAEIELFEWAADWMERFHLCNPTSVGLLEFRHALDIRVNYEPRKP